MNRSGDNTSHPNSDAIEALLEQADPRPSPPVRDEQIVRDAVYAEWQRTTRRRRSRRGIAGFAIAASVLLGVAVSFEALRGTGIAPVEVATIDRSYGSIYLQSDQAQPVDVGDIAPLFAGQTMTTGDDAGAGLQWAGGGSLRVDRNTRIEFLSVDEVYLYAGRLYFDSASGSAAALRVDTQHGSVTHVGTQFMTRVDRDGLIVSVREGQVDIAGRYYDQSAYEGQRVELAGSAGPAVTNTSGTGPDWMWVEAVSPRVNVDGRSAYEFLQWVGRETGFAIEFAGTEAEQLARDSVLIGTVESDPRSELRLRMLTVDLSAEFDSARSVLVVSRSQ